MLEAELTKYNKNKDYIIYENDSAKDKIQSLTAANKKLSEDIEKRDKNLDSVINEKKAEYSTKLNELKQDINAVLAKNKKFADEINDIQKKMSVDTLDIEETKGEVSECIYWEQPDNKSDYTEVFRIRHNFKPILMLYRADTISDNQKIDMLYPIIDKIAVEFFKNNSIEVIQNNIVDTYKGAIDLQAKKFYNIYGDNLSGFYEQVERVINYVAMYQNGNTWNEMIVDMYEKTKNINYDYRCQITSIVVPPTELKKVVFGDSMWTDVVRGRDKGFIPIFFVDESNYDNYNPDKDAGTVIGEIKKIFTEKDNIYRVHLQTGIIG